MSRARVLLFRIFYSTSFTIVFLVLVAFICISPADAIYQSYRHRRIIDIFLIAGVYIVTALIAALIYASRLYTTRSVLKDIPKTYVPLDKEELPGKRTWRLISETVKRSAVIALQAKPRAYRIENEVEEARERIGKLLRPDERKDVDGGEVSVPTKWGVISHAGWSSPADEELPDLQYEVVVGELTDLVEAKAVSLAPVDPLATPAQDGRAVPDAMVIEALARPDTAGMREYVGRLIELEVIGVGEVTTSFLTLYERARFSVVPLAELEFKNLMRLFAELLRGMKSVNVDLIDLGDDRDDGDDVDGYDDESVVDRKSIAKSQFSSISSISGSVRRYALTPRPESPNSVLIMSTGEG